MRTLGPQDLAELEPLIEACAHKPYRHYRMLSRRAQTDVMRAEIEATLQHADGVSVAVSAGGRAAVAIARVLAWETDFFGVRMGRLEFVLGAPEARGAVAAAAIDALAARGVRHVSARADVADIETTALLEARGFRLMDCLVTYTARPKKEPPAEMRDVGIVRAFAPTDADELVALANDAYRGFRGRFHLDPHLPDDRCDAFYTEWARQSVALNMADTILVSEGAGGRLLGFLAFRRREPVSSVSGVPVFGGGLGACRADAPGAYAGLIRAGTRWAHDRQGVAECQTQNYNFPVIRIYEAVGLHYVRAEYTLHAWLG